ncbi:MAG TPA: dihydroorotate dehydrogenase-like protein, partial [Actinomycetota bacterium]|nr:dihydroorotate dehydrogenase-like protein [Actinomycetota bacterium]
MADLRTRYLGMELRSPLVASSSPLTGSLDGLLRLEAAGAGAVVLPSLFEEDLAEEARQVGTPLATGATAAEARAGHPAQAGYGAGPAAYLALVAQAKNSLSIPVVASLNGASRGGWVRYAARLEVAGADALELNIYYVSSRPGLSGSEVEWHYLDVVRAVRRATRIPLAVKLSPYFSSLANLAGQLVEAGANGLVLFNRFYQPDLDIEAMEVQPALELSSSVELRLPLRWIAILHRRFRVSLAASTGVHTATDVLKVLLAGADVAHDDLGPAAQRPRPPTLPGNPGPRLDGPPRLRHLGAAPGPPEPAVGSRPGRLRTGQLPQDPRLPPDAQPLTDPGRPQAERPQVRRSPSS